MSDDTEVFTKSLESRPALARKAVTYRAFARVLDKVVDMLVTVQRAQHSKRAALEERVAKLEATQLQFKGTYSESEMYVPNCIARRAGSMWICTAPTHGAFDHACWELLVKKGAARDDGR